MNDLTIIEYQGQRVLTTKQLAESYETTENSIRNNYTANKQRFLEGVAYFKLEGDELEQFKNYIRNSDIVSKNAPSLYLWTKKGCFLHAKSLGTDKAWEVYESLVDHYFLTCSLPTATNTVDPKTFQMFVQAVQQSNQTAQLCVKAIEQNTQVLTALVSGFAAMNQKIDNLIETISQNNSPLIPNSPSELEYSFCRQIPAQRISKIGLSKMNSLEMPLKLEVIKRRFLNHDTFVELARFLSDRGISISRSAIHNYFNQVLQELQLEDENNLQIIEQDGPVTRHITVKNGQVSVQVTQIG
jgi:hypothetical protein